MILIILLDISLLPICFNTFFETAIAFCIYLPALENQRRPLDKWFLALADDAEAISFANNSELPL